MWTAHLKEDDPRLKQDLQGEKGLELAVERYWMGVEDFHDFHTFLPSTKGRFAQLPNELKVNSYRFWMESRRNFEAFLDLEAK